MSYTEDELAKDLENQEYKFGFTTDIGADQAPKGLNEDIIRFISAKKEEDFRVMSKNGDSYYLLKPEEIYYVKADLSEVMLRTAKGFSYYAQKISSLEEKLSAYNFVRVHRSYLINIDKIKEMETIEQSKLRFSFEGIADEVESSKDGAKEFRNRFSFEK